ncbi:thioredoxin domain-containing protein [Gryllotalpicola ginsengisoli]|uniref:thioredoxin domain-containing protein n=1 Tax=Gryllotalpicola ginsengisoli TaxID=444608 RepID=UPI0003B67E2D|nr:thioredoxin domain-containing protein [Gryllotalpicola ginsengisoli]
MGNRLADAISPYLRSHADNPVDWWPWGPEPFAAARERDVPVLVSIGYATCHWCHVMARESFSDPELAAYLNERFVAIKVDREEHPDVDSAYLTAAGAFIRQLGWPLTAFVTPEGRMFYAGTYFPPQPVGQVPAFRQILDAVTDAWTNRRAEVESSAGRLAEAIAQAARAAAPADAALPDEEDLDAAVARIAAGEDREHGGFGTAPKFPVAPALAFLLGRPWGEPVARRALETMAASPLRDPVEGGFFRYATQRDWSAPHYERMLYDNAQLLRLYADAGLDDVAAGIAGFLEHVLRAGVGFASAQDSESAEGEEAAGYYRLTAAERADRVAPALDRKVLAGWNGLAIGALAHAGRRLGRVEWVRLAASVADGVLAVHLRETPEGVRVVRASLDGRVSEAPATLEDYGMLSGGLIDLALATGEVRYFKVARRLVDAVLGDAAPFSVPGGAEPVLAAQGLAVEADPSEGAYPSGASACAWAAHRLYLLTAERRYDAAARDAVRRVAARAMANPIAFGAALDLASALEQGPRQLVIVTTDASPDPGPFAPALRTRPPHELVAVVTEAQARAFAEAGFELFAGRNAPTGEPTAYACSDFVCELPVTGTLRDAR